MPGHACVRTVNKKTMRHEESENISQATGAALHGAQDTSFSPGWQNHCLFYLFSRRFLRSRTKKRPAKTRAKTPPHGTEPNRMEGKIWT
jgi:hypothetical protein